MTVSSSQQVSSLSLLVKSDCVEIQEKIRTTYNFSSTFCLFVPNYAAGYLKKSYSKGTFDLQDLDLHNAIEHDGSLVREQISLFDLILYVNFLSLVSTGEDFYSCPDQSKIAVPLIEQLVAYASGKDADGKPLLTPKDLSQALSQRAADSKATNPQFSTSFMHRLFGGAKSVLLLTVIFSHLTNDITVFSSSTLLTIFGGRMDDIRTLLFDECLPDGWESRVRSHNGLTFGAFNSTVLKVLIGVKEVPPSPSKGQPGQV